MTQVEIAKKILEQGNCNGMACSYDKCGFLIECSNRCRMQLGNTSEMDLDKVKQWLKEQEKEMIDLTVNQIVNPPVKCWIKDNTRWKESELCSIDHRGKYPYMVNDKGWRTNWLTCTLTDPTKPKFKPWLKIEDVPVEMWSRNLYKHKDEPISSGDILCPYKISDDEGNLIENLVYLPLGQPLNSGWLEMGNFIEE